MLTREDFEAFLAGLDLPLIPSLYEHLPTGPYFRVVRFHELCTAPEQSLDLDDVAEDRPTGGRHTYLRCSLIVRRTDDAAPYTALSYRCEANQAENRLLVDGHPVSVMRTVWDFVHQEMLKGDCPDMFIDSVCISPFDLGERSSQVQLMAAIYSNAALVYVWLGEQVCCTDMVLELWHKARHTGRGRPPLGTAMHHLFSTEYWSRGWVVQEFVLATALQIRCGRQSLTLEMLTDFFEGLVKGNIAQMSKAHAGEFFAMPAFKIFDQRNRKRSKRPLAKVLMDNRRAKCTDVRDKVYAFLGLVSDVTLCNPFPVDYSSAATSELLLHKTIDFCRLLPDSTVAFCYRMRDSLGLNRLSASQNADNDSRFLSSKAWRVGIIDGPVTAQLEDGPSSASSGSFSICHATERARKMEVSSDSRIYLELQIESALFGHNHLDTDGHDGWVKADDDSLLLVGSAAEEVSFDDLGNRMLLEHKQRQPQTLSATYASVCRYSCTRFIGLESEEKERKSMVLLTAYAAEPGDIVCQFLGVHTSLVLRKQGDFYLPVGKGFLDDNFHQIWMGSSWESFFHGDQKPHLLTQRHFKQLDAINMAASYSTVSMLA